MKAALPITDGKFSYDGDGYTVSDPALEKLIGKLTVTQTSDGNHTTVTLPTGESLILNDDGTYTYTFTGADGNVTRYIITIDPGNISKFNNENVSVNVGNGKNENGVFTNDGYTIENETIRKLLDGVIKVTTNDNEKTTLDFVDKSEGVFIDNGDGTFIYNKNGVDYPFTKTGDNTYTFTITDGATTTNYTLTINPGNVTNYFDEDVLIEVGNGTLRDGIFIDNGYTVDNDLINDLLSGELNVTYDRGAKTTDVEFSKPDNLTTDGADYSYFKDGTTYTFTKNADGTFKYVVTDGNSITDYNVTITKGALTVTNSPTSTPSTNTTSTATPTTPTPSRTTTTTTTPTPSRTTTTTTTSNPFTTTTSTPSPTPITSTPSITTPTQTTTETPVDNPVETPLDNPVETPLDNPIETPLDNPVETPLDNPAEIPLDNPVNTTENVELEDPDYELRSSRIEEFPEEKGDYVDLDSQDHILIETIDTNAEVKDLDVVPEEFNKAADRNIVNNSNNELTSIDNAQISTETPMQNETSSGLTNISTGRADNSNSTTSNSTSTSTQSNLTSVSTSRADNSNSTTSNSTSTSTQSNLTSVSTSRTDNSNSTTSTGNDDSESNLSANTGDELGNIESGRSDSSQEVTAENQTSSTSNSDTQNSSDTESTGNDNSQKSAADNKTGEKDSSNDDDDDDDKDSEGGN